MKKYILALGIIALFFSTTIAQKSVKIFLLDSISQTPIDYVKVTNKTVNEVSYTGFDGSVDINFKASSVVLELENLAYQGKMIKVMATHGNPQYFYLKPVDLEMNEIIVSASKNKELRKNTPYSVKTISNTENDKSIIYSADDFLQNQSTFSISRPHGIYTNSPLITTTGMGGMPGRTLVMFDGIKLNKADDGNVNWNMLSSSNIEKTEIISNSASTLYGNNAMGGAVNFIAKRPKKTGYHGFVGTHYGSNNTFGGEINTSFRAMKAKGFYLNLNAFAQMSDGYISTPDSLQYEGTEYIPTYLQEIKANLLLGYDFNKNNKFEIIYNFYDDKRGLGEKIQEEKGSYTEHDSHLIIGKYSAKRNKLNWGLNIYAQDESYFKNIENVKKDEYSLIYVNSKRQDVGSDIYFNYRPVSQLSVTSGVNLKSGLVDGQDNYQTSTDIVNNKGELASVEVFMQTKISLLKKNNLHFVLGANYSYSYLRAAEFSITNPTFATDFMTDFTGTLEDNVFKNFSFNTGARYNFSKTISTWASFNSGHNSPTLEDMTRSGLNRYGFKLANPNLYSEQLYNTNYGIGYFGNKLNFSINGNYNIGNDFIYYIETGDAIFGGNKPIIQKQNITQVKMYNISPDFNYKLDKFEFFANYTYNISKISKFDSIHYLEGKYLMYSPIHKANAGFLTQISVYKFAFTGHYNSEQYTNNENVQSIAPYYTFDFKLTAEFIKNLQFSYGVQNILNYQYLIFYDQLSVGRFMTASLKYTF